MKCFCEKLELCYSIQMFLCLTELPNIWSVYLQSASTFFYSRKKWSQTHSPNILFSGSLFPTIDFKIVFSSFRVVYIWVKFIQFISFQRYFGSLRTTCLCYD